MARAPGEAGVRLRPSSSRLVRFAAIEPGRQRVEFAPIARRKDLLVAWLDLLESDGLALLLPEPVGDRLGTLLVAAGHVKSKPAERAI